LLPLLLLLLCVPLDVSSQAYAGLRTADRLDEQYVFIPQKVKDVYLHHLLLHCLASLQQQQQQGTAQPAAAAAAEQGSGSEGFKRVRSAIIFVSTCKGCHMLSLVLRELGLPAAALHSGEYSCLLVAATVDQLMMLLLLGLQQLCSRC
jgi:superfamily II DNA/RNA helicase